jgi:hypothetical protein
MREMEANISNMYVFSTVILDIVAVFSCIKELLLYNDIT